MEERLHVTIPPWVEGARVHSRLDIGATILRDMPGTVRKRAPDTHLATRPADAVWVWSDGSAEGGVSAGGSGALSVLPTGVEQELRAPAGNVCSSTRTELWRCVLPWSRCCSWRGPRPNCRWSSAPTRSLRRPRRSVRMSGDSWWRLPDDLSPCSGSRPTAAYPGIEVGPAGEAGFWHAIGRRASGCPHHD